MGDRQAARRRFVRAVRQGPRGPAAERRPINLYGGTIDVYRGGPIDADVPVEFLLSRSSVREFRVDFLERHMLLGQSFFPLAGGGFIAVVAAPDAPLSEHGIPALDEIHAFLVPAACGITLHRGTWHEETAVPARRGHDPPDDDARGPVWTASSRALDERREISGLDVDKRNLTERSGVTVRIALP